MKRRRQQRLWCLGVSALAWCSTGAAQYRADDHPALQPAPAPASQLPRAHADNTATVFAQAYARAGRPRIVLMWNRELDDATQQESMARLVLSDSGTSSTTSLTQPPQGGLETATPYRLDGSFSRSTVLSSGRHVVQVAPRSTRLSEIQAAMLQRAFSQEMGRGGVRFVDRALVVRTTAAAHHRGGGDAKLIETDALLAHAELMMEVLLLEDSEAPAGYGFDVRAKELRSGRELVSIYTRASPPAPAQADGKWVAGKDGYEYRLPAAAPAPTPAQVGAALAREVLVALGDNLKPVRAQPAARR